METVQQEINEPINGTFVLESDDQTTQDHLAIAEEWIDEDFALLV